MNKNQNEDNELVWGEITPEKIFKNMYKRTRFEDMSDAQVDQMLEDLI